MRRYRTPAALVVAGFLVSGCNGPVTDDWSEAQRQQARQFLVQSLSLSAQGALAGWDNEEWRTAGHIGIGALTDLALRMNAPETAADIAAMDNETLEALVREAQENE